MIKECFNELSGVASLKKPVGDTLKWLLVDSTMRQRLLVTVCVIVVLQLISHINLPGIDMSILYSGSQTVFIKMFAVNALTTAYVFVFWLKPFLGACLLLQFASIFIPKLRVYSFGGESGREKMVRLTYILAIIISIVYAYAMAQQWENLALNGLIVHPGWGFRLMIVATVAAALCFLLFLADVVNKYGIGNGVAIISTFFIVSSAHSGQIIDWEQSRRIAPGVIVLLLMIFLVLVGVIFYFTNRSKVVEITDGKNNTSIPFRNSMVGQEPIGWGISLIVLWGFIVARMHSAGGTFLPYPPVSGTILNVTLFSILIGMFVYLYALIVFDAKYLNGLMKKYGFSLVAVHNKGDEQQLKNMMHKALVVTVFILCLVNMIPNMMIGLLKMPYAFATLWYGTAILLGVGVFSDILHQAEFFRNKADSGISHWAVCYTACDEFEATIKAEFLKGKGISSMVEPLRFSWGMPVRTVIDQYKIHVPVDKKDVARGLLMA